MVVYEIANVDATPVTSLRTGVPLDLERMITKAMAKSPDERYQHMDEMLVDLKRLAKGSQTAPPSTATHRIHDAPTNRNWKKTIALAALLPILLALFFILKPLVFDDILVSEPKPVAVVAFVNQTGDQSFDYLREAIPNLLITSLEQSKYLRVMTWERMNDLLKQMGKQDVKLIDKDLGFELCRREGIHAIVIGTFVKAGDAFATDVKVLDVVTKELLKTASVRGDGVQRILTSQIDFAEARNQIQAYRDAILRTSPQTPVYIQGTVDLLHAILFLKAGRVDSARIRTNAFRSALPSVEYIRSTLQMLGGILEGEVLLAERKPDSAIAVCRAAPVIGPSNAVGWRMALYSVPEFRDLVPRAFQMKGNLDSAIVEYERLMTLDTNSVDRRWSQPLYHYRLATVCMKAGKNDKARAEFTRFLEIWKDADKDRAEFRDAKKQLARLGNSSQ